MNQISHADVTRELNYALYSHLYDRLLEMGYRARFGQNTFSVSDDEGVSSYLRHRMNAEGMDELDFWIILLRQPLLRQ